MKSQKIKREREFRFYHIFCVVAKSKFGWAKEQKVAKDFRIQIKNANRNSKIVSYIVDFRI